MIVSPLKQQTQIHLSAIALIAIVVVIPIFSYGIYDAHDLPAFHLRWAKQFSDQFWSGELYPRWLLNLNAGLGSPTFFFYSPIPYYFTSLLRPLVWVSDPYGWHQLSFGAELALMASGITAYVWLRSLVLPTAALIGAIFYLVAPYHLAIDLYARFAYAEFWSFVWFPLILYFTQKIVDRQKGGAIGFTIVQALLIMTHLPSFLIFSIVPFLYLFWFSNARTRIRTVIFLSFAFLLAVGVSAVYWLPAMTTKEFVILKADPSQYKYFRYEDNFLFSGAIYDSLKGFIAFVEISSVLTLVLAIFSFLIARKQSTPRSSLFWIAIALASGWMMFPISNPIWQLLQPLQVIELPWRFNVILTIALTALAALSVRRIQFTRRMFLSLGAFLVLGTGLAMFVLLPVRDVWLTWNPSNKLWLSGVTVGCAIAAAFGLYSIRLTHHRTIAVSVLLAMILLVSSGLLMKRSLFPVPQLDTELEIQRDAVLHRPKWVPASLYTTDALRQFTRDHFGSDFTIEAQNQVTVSHWQSRKLRLQTNLSTEQWLTLKQFYFPGWTATIGHSTLPVQPSPDGLLQVKIPAGNHAIAVDLKPLIQEQIGIWLSAISTTVLFVFLALSQRRSQSNPVAMCTPVHLRSSTSIK